MKLLLSIICGFLAICGSVFGVHEEYINQTQNVSVMTHFEDKKNYFINAQGNLESSNMTRTNNPVHITTTSGGQRVYVDFTPSVHLLPQMQYSYSVSIEKLSSTLSLSSIYLVDANNNQISESVRSINGTQSNTETKWTKTFTCSSQIYAHRLCVVINTSGAELNLKNIMVVNGSVLPQNFEPYGVIYYSQNTLDNVVQSNFQEGKTTGINQVKNNPNDYGLYTQTQYTDYGNGKYAEGKASANYGIDNLFMSIADVPFKTLSNFLNIPVFGTTIWVMLGSMVTLLLVVYIIKKVI
jgi:hypothetical protein